MIPIGHQLTVDSVRELGTIHRNSGTSRIESRATGHNLRGCLKTSTVESCDLDNFSEALDPQRSTGLE